MSIGKRLEQLRNEHGLVQPQLAELCGVSKKTIIEYEKDRTSPTAVFLAVLAEKGWDIQYIITGVRTEELIKEQAAEYQVLSNQAKALVDNWEHCPEGVQHAISQLALASRKDNMDESKTQE